MDLLKGTTGYNTVSSMFLRIKLQSCFIDKSSSQAVYLFCRTDGYPFNALVRAVANPSPQAQLVSSTQTLSIRTLLTRRQNVRPLVAPMCDCTHSF